MIPINTIQLLLVMVKLLTKHQQKYPHIHQSLNPPDQVNTQQLHSHPDPNHNPHPPTPHPPITISYHPVINGMTRSYSLEPTPTIPHYFNNTTSTLEPHLHTLYTLNHPTDAFCLLALSIG